MHTVNSSSTFFKTISLIFFVLLFAGCGLKKEVEFSGKINDAISKDLNFNFKDVKLANITPKIDSLNLKGIVNGTLYYNQLLKKLIF